MKSEKDQIAFVLAMIRGLGLEEKNLDVYVKGILFGISYCGEILRTHQDPGNHLADLIRELNLKSKEWGIE